LQIKEKFVKQIWTEKPAMFCGLLSAVIFTVGLKFSAMFRREISDFGQTKSIFTNKHQIERYELPKFTFYIKTPVSSKGNLTEKRHFTKTNFCKIFIPNIRRVS
jgi:hypothetical protein